MAKLNLSRLDFEALMDLRTQVDQALSAQRSTLERQLERLGGAIASVGSGRGRRRRSLKGQKVAPKYRGPAGELWAGRGARPRWLEAALKTGKKVEDFLIDKAAAATEGEEGEAEGEAQVEAIAGPRYCCLGGSQELRGLAPARSGMKDNVAINALIIQMRHHFSKKYSAQIE
jgi:DNA-binding protein H-NS